MKKARILVLVLFWTVLVHGASFRSQTGQAQERTSSRNGEKSADSLPPENNDAQGRGEKDQRTEHLPSDENQKSFAAVKAGTREHHPVVSYAKLPQNRRPRSAKPPGTTDLQTAAFRNVPGSHQTSPRLSSNGPGKTVSHSSLAVHPSTVALNGQQFKNARDPGARMATSAGPANSTRGTAVINGSDMKRKP